MSVLRQGVAVSVVSLVLLVVASPAAATSPGRNGLLFFDLALFAEGEMGMDLVDTQVLRSVHVKTGRVRTVQKQCPPANENSVCDHDAPAVSPNGKLIAFERRLSSGGADPEELYIAVSTTTGSRMRVVAEEGFEPSWSLDGKRLVFQRAPSPGEPDDLYTVGTDGTGLRRLTRGGAGIPDWSSRGGIAFVRARRPRPGAREIGVISTIRPDGTGLRRLTGKHDSNDPSWSPDGRQLVYVRYRGRTSDLYVMRSNGSHKRLLVARGYSPVWSPDGARIAFVRGRNIYVIRPDGSDLRRVYRASRRITESKSPTDRLAWQPRA